MNTAIRLARQECSATALVDVSAGEGASAPESSPRPSSPTPASPTPEAQRRQGPVRLAGVPGRLDEAMLPGDAASANPNELPDVILLTEANAAALLTRRFVHAAAAIVPIVDVTGRGHATKDHRRADLALERVSQRAIDEAVEMLQPAVKRLRALPREILETDDRRLMLLARLFVRDRAMVPRSEVGARETFVYDDEAAIPGAAALAKELAAQGLLESKFADKTSVCPHCASARMTVREYCSCCGGADLVEEPIVHHLKCAYQGPERDFRRGAELACPKCLQQLKNFSVDYDRPGSIGICASCSHLSTEHKVGFLCLDCDARVEARNVDSRTIHSYALTPAGCACVTGGAALPQAEDVSIGGKIRSFARRHAARGEPCSILFVRLHRQPEMPETGDAWRQTCVFFAEIMRERFTLETEIIDAAPIFLALLGNDSKDEVARHLPRIRERLERHLALAPKIELALFSPDEVGIAERPKKVA